MGVSKNSGTPKSSILIGFSIINHPLWGTPIFGNAHIMECHGPVFVFTLLTKGETSQKICTQAMHGRHILPEAQAYLFLPLPIGSMGLAYLPT